MKFSILALLVAFSSAVLADNYEVLSESTSAVGTNLLKTVKSIQVVTTGPLGNPVRNPLNRFNVYRIRHSTNEKVGPVLLRSPFNFDIRYYEITDGNLGNYDTTFIANLAKKNLDVWVLDDRINFQAPGTCELLLADCSIMKTWTLANKINDIEYVRGLVAQVWPTKKPVVGGYVGAAIDTMAAVNANPAGYSGLFAWEGSLYSADQSVKDYNADYCSQETTKFNLGLYYDQTPAAIKLLLLLTAIQPNNPAPPFPFPVPVGLTTRQLLYFILTTHVDNAAYPTPWWITATGTFLPAHLNYAEEIRILQLGPVANNYAATATVRDYACSFAGARTYNDNLSAFTGHVLMIGGGLAMGPLLEDTATLFTNAASVDVTNEAGYGEQDMMMNANRKTLIDERFADWAVDILN